ncbi:hypothetical protein V8E36_002034 [Tilletia maclaganii]
MGQPATAAIIVACIFLGLGFIYFSYRLYIKIHTRGARKLAEQQQQQEQYEAALPHHRPPPGFTQSSSGKSSPSQPNTTFIGTSSASTPTSGSKYPFNSRPSYHAPYHFHPPKSSTLPIETSSSASSALASPASDPNTSPPRLEAAAAAALAEPSPAASSSLSPSPVPSSAFGANTSTSAIQRQYAAARQHGTSPQGTLTPAALAALGSNGNTAPSAATANGNGSVYGGSEHGTGAGSSIFHNNNNNAHSHHTVPSLYGTGPRVKRESYLPHLNREAMQIVTPSPLGFGLGGMATATDQRTLAFSKASGIGDTASLLSDPLLSATITSRENVDGTAPQPGGGGNGAEWEQRVNAYRAGAASADSPAAPLGTPRRPSPGTGHAQRSSVSSFTAAGPGPGPSTNTPAAEYLAQQQRELRLKGSSTSSNSASTGGGPSSPPSAYRGPSPGRQTQPPPKIQTSSLSQQQQRQPSSASASSSRTADEETRRLSVLTARQSPLQRMSSGEIWTKESQQQQSQRLSSVGLRHLIRRILTPDITTSSRHQSR